jgi:excisionase family DNA binding protein
MCHGRQPISGNRGRKRVRVRETVCKLRNGGQEGRGVEGNNERLLTPGEVAALFRVDPKTVTRWAASGRISSIRTPGGHRRFRESEVRALLRGESPTAEDRPPAQ